MERHETRPPRSLVCDDWPDCQCDGSACNPFGPHRPLLTDIVDIVLLASITGIGAFALLWFSLWFWSGL